MNRVYKSVTLGLTTLSLLGCSTTANYYVGAISSRTPTSISSRYTKFVGDDSIDIKVEGTTIKVEITTKSGILDVEISNGTENPYEGHINEDMAFTVNVTPGNYKISLHGNEHSGSYKFDWGN